MHAYFPFDAARPAGGVQRVATMLVRGLVAAGTAVRVVCPSGPGPEWVDGAEVWRGLRYRDGLPYDAADHAHDGALWLEATAGCDVAWSLDRAPLARAPIPWVLTVNTISYEAPLLNVQAGRFDAIVVPSPFLAARVGHDAAVIPNPVDVAPARATPSDTRRVLFPHRPDPEKGFDTALAALERLVAADERFRLLVPREPDTRHAALYAQLERHPHVAVHDWVQPDALGSYYAGAEATLTLSRLPEGFGLVPLESVAAGTPAVSTRSGALGDLLPDDHGLAYVDTDDPAAVADAVLHPPSAEAVARGAAHVRARHAPADAVAAYQRALASS